MLSEEQIKQALLEDLENKKEYECRFATTCSVAGCELLAGDDLYFYGQKKKMCSTCLHQMIAYLKGEV